MADFSYDADRMAERLKACRGQRSLTDIAQKAGCATGHLSHLERGSYKPSGELCCNLADALETTPEWLMQGRNGSLAREFAPQFWRLSTRDQAIIIATINAMLREPGDG